MFESHTKLEFPSKKNQPLSNPLYRYLLNELPRKRFELPSSCCCCQKQIQALSRQHVPQDPQKAFRGLGVVSIYCLMHEKERVVFIPEEVQMTHCGETLLPHFSFPSPFFFFYLKDIGDSGLCSQDETWVGLDISIFCSLQSRGKLPVLSP